MANPNQDARTSDGRYARTPETAERDADAARLRARGHTYREIAAQLGYPSEQAARKGARKVITEIVREPAEELLAIELERLDAELVRLNELEAAARQVMTARHIVVSNGHVITHPDTGQPMEDDGPVLQAVDRLVKIEDARRRNAERRARLLGLDSPTRVDATVHEVTQQDLELQEMVNSLKAKNAAIEADLRGSRTPPGD